MEKFNNYLELFETLLDANSNLEISMQDLNYCVDQADRSDDIKSILLNVAMAGYMYGVAIGTTEARKAAEVCY